MKIIEISSDESDNEVEISTYRQFQPVVDLTLIAKPKNNSLSRKRIIGISSDESDSIHRNTDDWSSKHYNKYGHLRRKTYEGMFRASNLRRKWPSRSVALVSGHVPEFTPLNREASTSSGSKIDLLLKMFPRKFVFKAITLGSSDT